MVHRTSFVIKWHEYIKERGDIVINSGEIPIETTVEYALEHFKSHG